MAATMKAVVITKIGGPEVLEIQEVSKPVPASGEVLIEVKAFGLNHAEMHMRKGEWGNTNPISGLECVGVVAGCPNGEFAVGTKVLAVLGGMAITRPGSYGDFVTVPVSNVVTFKTELDWAPLAAIPEVYLTAYTCVFTILNVKKGESLLIRGATSTIGQAAVHLAVDAGAKVTGTTRRKERFELLKGMGAQDVKPEKKDLAAEFADGFSFDKVLNLVGNSVLLESISLTRVGGRMLQAGWLGGLAPVADFNPMNEMKPGVHFSLFHGKVFGSPGFPLSGIPVQEIITKIERKTWETKPAHIFQRGDIRKAHELLDSQDTGGKIVITV